MANKITGIEGVVVKFNANTGEGLIRQTSSGVRNDGKPFQHHLRAEDFSPEIVALLVPGNKFRYAIVEDDKAVKGEDDKRTFWKAVDLVFIKTESNAQPSNQGESKKQIERMSVIPLAKEESGVISIAASDYPFQIQCRDEKGKYTDDKVIFVSSISVNLFDLGKDETIANNCHRCVLDIPKTGLLLMVHSSSISDVNVCFVSSFAYAVAKILRYGV